MKGENNINISLVNPLNPDEILRTETITVEKNIENSIQENIEEQNVMVETNVEIEENPKEKPKKSFNLIILTILTLVIAVLGISYYIIVSGNKSNIPVNNEQNNTPQVNTTISLQDISNTFNQNIANYFVADNSTTISSVSNDKIAITVVLPDTKFNYEFSLNDGILSTIIAKDDNMGQNITIYILSSIAYHNKISFNDAVSYFSNLQTLDNVNNIDIIDMQQVQQINVNLNEIMEIQ